MARENREQKSPSKQPTEIPSYTWLPEESGGRQDTHKETSQNITPLGRNLQGRRREGREQQTWRTIGRERNEVSRDNMGSSEEGCTESYALESCRWGPMLHQEFNGVSEVNGVKNKQPGQHSIRLLGLASRAEDPVIESACDGILPGGVIPVT